MANHGKVELPPNIGNLSVRVNMISPTSWSMCLFHLASAAAGFDVFIYVHASLRLLGYAQDVSGFSKTSYIPLE